MGAEVRVPLEIPQEAPGLLPAWASRRWAEESHTKQQRAATSFGLSDWRNITEKEAQSENRYRDAKENQ